MYSEKISRGDVIYYIKSSVEKTDSGECNLRPAIVVQNNVGNKFSSIITIIPLCLIQKESKLLPTHVAINCDGLKEQNNYAIAEQIHTIDKKRIVSIVGKVDEATMQKVNKSIIIQLDLLGGIS